jgi:hypothetical protein
LSWPKCKGERLDNQKRCKGKGEGKGRGRVAVMNVEEIAKSRAQEQNFKSMAAMKLVKFCKRSVWEVRGGKI